MLAHHFAGEFFIYCSLISYRILNHVKLKRRIIPNPPCRCAASLPLLLEFKEKGGKAMQKLVNPSKFWEFLHDCCVVIWNKGLPGVMASGWTWKMLHDASSLLLWVILSSSLETITTPHCHPRGNSRVSNWAFIPNHHRELGLSVVYHLKWLLVVISSSGCCKTGAANSQSHQLTLAAAWRCSWASAFQLETLGCGPSRGEVHLWAPGKANQTIVLQIFEKYMYFYTSCFSQCCLSWLRYTSSSSSQDWLEPINMQVWLMKHLGRFMVQEPTLTHRAGESVWWEIPRGQHHWRLFAWISMKTKRSDS